MRRSMAIAFTSATVAGLMLAPTAAFAASGNSAIAGHAAVRNVSAEVGPTQDTTVTFAVTNGALTLTAPSTADLGSGAPGDDITHALGNVSVQDNRAALVATWTVTASSTDFDNTTTGGVTQNEIIPATDVAYTVGTITHTGTITTAGTDLTSMSNGGDTVVTGSSGEGDNTATWDPTLTVHVPGTAVTGTYQGTITHSVA